MCRERTLEEKKALDLLNDQRKLPIKELEDWVAEREQRMLDVDPNYVVEACSVNQYKTTTRLL